MITEAFPGGLVAPQEWLDGILPRAPNAPQDFVKFIVLQKAREFFTKSGAWRDWIGPITLHDDTPLYSLEFTDVKAELVAILDGYRLQDGAPLRPVAGDQAAVDWGRTERGDPSFFYQTPEGVACILPLVPVGTTEQVKLFVTMKPIDLCMPDWIRSKHFDVICDGALSVIHLTKGVNFDKELGARLERRFKSATSAAAQEAIASGTGLGERVPIPCTAPQGSQRLRLTRTQAVSGRVW